MSFSLPDLSEWLVYCNHCREDRRVTRHEERDENTGEAYYEWTCRKCDTPVLTHHAGKAKRAGTPGKAGLS
jgi:hypothetical protein